MELLFSNYASSTLLAGISAVDTSLTIQAGDGSNFPSVGGTQYLIATLEDDTANKEIVKVTSRVGDIFTIERAQEGTLARSYGVNSRFELRITADFLKNFVDGRAFLDPGVKIRISRSELTGDAPVALDNGEIALNITDKILFVGDSNNLPVAIPIPNLGYSDWSFPASDFTAESGGRYFVSSNIISSVLLPAAPDVGRAIQIADLERSWDGTTIVSGNGNTIEGAATLPLENAGDSLEFSFDGAEWKTARVVTGTWGSKNARVTIHSANYTLVLSNDGEFIPFDTTAGDIVFTLLPAAVAGDGFRFEMSNEGTSGNTVDIDGVIIADGVSATVWCDGTDWHVVLYGEVSPFISGTTMLFVQPAAPSGWTFSAALSDSLFISTATEALGGTLLAGGSWNITGINTSAEDTPHNHSFTSGQPSATTVVSGGASPITVAAQNHLHSGTTGDESVGHAHTATGDGTWRPKAINTIVCVKN